jgi:hypothetical protein
MTLIGHEQTLKVSRNFKLKSDMNKNFLLTAPIGAALGNAICSGYLDGFSKLDWYRVITVMLVTFVIELLIVYFEPKSK